MLSGRTTLTARKANGGGYVIRTTKEICNKVSEILALRGVNTEDVLPYDSEGWLVGWQVTRGDLVLRWGQTDYNEPWQEFSIKVLYAEDSEDDGDFIVEISDDRNSDHDEHLWDFSVARQAPSSFAYFHANAKISHGTIRSSGLTLDFDVFLDWIDRLVRAFMNAS